ncbi:hypothetical protein FSP39_008929 [Pinctada imbricata]|uniref:VDE lipocalin domain-containing protein n=1 Tax=Pinctada imbricata TaxID=66713 RepID=A0AA89C2X5_PINIB|nr:hypothetical protein FSP39_008929 [Pinctada imbricata]
MVAFLLFLGFLSTAFSAGPNIPCMMFNCASQSAKCFANSDCRALMMCLTKCGQTNQTCMFDCIYSYENDIFDDFMKCASTEHNCIELAPPDPPVVCKKPTQVVQNFSLDMMEGSWYIVKGLNPIYDCFDCQITRFYKGDSQSMLKVNEKFEIHTVMGTTITRYVNESVTQPDPKACGIIKYSSNQMGHNTISEWRVLDRGQNGEYLFMYYCGSIAANYFYEGSVVYSKNAQLSPEAWTNIQKVGMGQGLKMNNFCSPKAGC